MAELKEGRLFEMFGRLHVENNLLREENARLSAEIVDLQAAAGLRSNGGDIGG